MSWLLTITHPTVLYENAVWSTKFIFNSLIHILVSFILLGICASDYLCINVTNIVHLKQNIMHGRNNYNQSNNQNINGSHNTNFSTTIMAILLSWCNSSPDLFSNLLSWTTTINDPESKETISLSIGEVLGSCGIILCMVQGTILIIMSKVDLNLSNQQKFNIIRDLICVLWSMILMTYIVYQNSITFINCCFMISTYIVYIFLKFNKKFQYNSFNNDMNTGGVTRDDGYDELGNSNNNNINNNSTNTNNENNLLRPDIKQSLISVMDFNTLLSMLENSNNNANNNINSNSNSSDYNTNNLANTGPFTNNSIFFQQQLDTDSNNTNEQELTSLTNWQNNEPFVQTLNQFNHDFNINNNENENRPLSEPIISVNNINNNYILQSQINSAPMNFAPYFDNPNDATNVNNNDPINRSKSILKLDLHKLQQRSKKINKLLVQVFFPHLYNVRSKNKIDIILSVLTTPFVFILQLSCPKLTNVLQYDSNIKNYSMSLVTLLVLILQSLIAPLMTIFLLTGLLNLQRVPLILWILFIILTMGLLCLLICLRRITATFNKFSLLQLHSEVDQLNVKDKERFDVEKLQFILESSFLAFGILNSILFISAIANSLIELMELYQKLTGISKAILGLTVFAWGNSISDLLSNIAMCRLYLKLPNQDNIEQMATNFFVIAFQSCLGGVMLNSMIGIGLSGFITMLFVKSDSGKWWFLRIINFGDNHSDNNSKFRNNNDYKFIISIVAVLLQICLLFNLISGLKILDKFTGPKLKMIGIAMCSLWGFATLCHIFMEVFQ